MHHALSYRGYIQRPMHILPADAKKFVKAKLTMGKKALSEHKFVNLFSEKGLAEFMTTGEIFELPRNSYTFPTLAERKIMLQIMISLCENGMADYRIIKDDYFAVSKNLCTTFLTTQVLTSLPETTASLIFLI